MSISVFQEKIIKGGCGKFVLLFCGAAMVFGMAFSNCSKSQKFGATDLKGEAVQAFATVGEIELPNSMVNEAIDTQMKRSSLSQYPPEILEMLPLESSLQPVIGGVVQTVQLAQVYEMAKKFGYSKDDESVIKAMHKTSEADFMNDIMDRAKKSGSLKENATIKDLEELLKAELKGRTLKEIYAEQKIELDNALKDNSKHLGAVLTGAQQFMLAKLSEGINPTEDEVKKSFDNFEIKQILVKSSSAAEDASAKAKVDKAYAELKANRSFESIMDGFSDEQSKDPKKKKSENMLSLGLSSIEQSTDYKIVLSLQPGAYTEPQKVAGGYAIIKFIGKKLTLPKDYEAQKGKYKQEVFGQIFQKKFKEEFDKIEKEVVPTFQSKSIEGAYKFGKAMSLPDGPAKEREFSAVYDLVKSVTGSDDRPDLAATLQVVAIQHIFDQPTSDKVKLKSERIASLENYLNYNNRWSYRKEVIDEYKAKGDKTKAFDHVLAALDKNTKFDSGAQQLFTDISAKFQEIKTAGLVSAEQETQFNTKRDLWRSDKDKYDKEAAVLKKQQDDDDKAKRAAEAANKPKGTLSPPTLPKKAPGK